MTLYRSLLGKVLDTLPAPVKTFHEEGGTWAGTANIRRGKHPLAHLVARQTGFPPAGENVAVTVTVKQTEKAEIWTRDFGGHVLSSRQEIVDNTLVETFGQTRVTLDLKATHDRLSITPIKWTVLGLPMPNFLLPRGETFEAADGERFLFNVTITAPIIGLIVAYRGTLEPVT
jgi:hypothetical protein